MHDAHIRSWTRRSLFTAAAAMTIAVGLLGCSPTSPPSEGAAAEAEILDLNLETFPGLLVYLPEEVALSQGIFEENGLNVTLINPGDGATMMRLLVSGDADGVQGTIDQALSARAQGQPLGFVGSMWNTNSFQIVTRPGVGDIDGDWREKLRALKGSTLGAGSIGSASDLLLRGLLEAVGLDPEKDVTIVAVPTAAAVVAQLEQGAIDGAIRSMPTGEQVALATDGEIYLDVASEAPAEFANDPTAMMTTESFVQEEPEKVSRWLKSMEAALAWLADPANEDAAVALIAEKYTGGDSQLAADVLLDLNESVYAAALPGLEVPQEAVEHKISNAIEDGAIKEGQVNIEDLILTP